MSNVWQRNGFALIELIPAILLVAAIGMISMRLLFIDMHMREQTRTWELVKQSHNRVFSVHKSFRDQIALCRLDVDHGWEVLYFPQGSWVPQDAQGKNWVMWRTRILEEQPYQLTARDYLLPGSTEWRWWDTLINMEYESEPAN